MEFDALKKSVGEFSTAQKQMAASISSLQASQQEIQKRMSSAQANPHWYSDPIALKLRSLAPSKPPLARPNPRDDNHNASPPLALTRSEVEASGSR